MGIICLMAGKFPELRFSSRASLTRLVSKLGSQNAFLSISFLSICRQIFLSGSSWQESETKWKISKMPYIEELYLWDMMRYLKLYVGKKKKKEPFLSQIKLSVSMSIVSVGREGILASSSSSLMEERCCCWPTSMSELPKGILLDIIARAPVKTIVIYKCVSKTWFDLLSLPYFAKLQFQKSICNKKLLTGASTNSSSSASPHWEEEVYQFDHEEDVRLQQFLHPAKIDGHWVSITFGSCNGMLLLSDKANKLHVYNPILKESVELLPVKSVTCWDRTHFGIGYSRVSDTYKVVQFHRDLHARVCVLGGGQETMSWRDIVPNLHYQDGYDIKSEASYCAHGALHWWRTQYLDYHDMSAATTSCSIVCFDIETEQFGLLSPSQFFRRFRDFDYLYISTYLGVLGGCLAVLCNCGFEFSIWVMKQYGVHESWTKEITFKVHQSDFFIAPLLMLKNGKLLFSGGRTYDPKDKTMKEGSGFTYLPHHVSYVPSLLSPKDV